MNENTQRPSVVIYAALSKKEKREQDEREQDERERGASIDSQTEEVKARLDLTYRDGYDLIGEFSDDGFSGSKRNRGPDLERAIAAAVDAAAAGGSAELWATDAARFGRGTGRAGEARALGGLFYELRAKGVTLRSVHDDEYVTREGFVGFGSEQAAKYAKDLSARVKRAKRRDAALGKHLGGKLPDGYAPVYTVDDHGRKHREVVLDPVRAKVVRRILKLAREGKPDTWIARTLNVEGITTRTGKAWTRRAVQDLVTRPFYAGWIVYEDEWHKGHHKRLIGPRQWKDLMELRDERDRGKGSHTTGRPAKRHALKGLAICGECGRPMYCRTSSYTRKDGSKARFYACPGYVEANETCDVSTFDAPTVDAAVIAALDGLLPDFQVWLDQVAERQSGARARAEEVRDRCFADRDAQAEVVAKREAKWEKYVDSDDEHNADLVLPMVEKARAELASLTTRAEAAQDALATIPEAAPTDAVLDFANALQRVLRGIDTNASIEQVNAKLGSVFASFVLHHEEGTIRIEPLMHWEIAHGIASMKVGGRDPAPWLVPEKGDPPPLRWVEAAASTNSEHSHA